ncbi:outer membrane protein assembly factor BamB [Roseimicrobium gellanilyticum]|uniref:Outer membrane protein assembly factor BamB n=1 Tax=Roseimicrobium gellanilyticum TaxID=748857 RepID=A0A366HTY3_9BACT|nr:PQQ-binding-like beta-propeller repeat protein [Roseimicrobium gellanilyticum]RBP47547.1 outer membrane protein assembly factor BamB [Roseimicrobium gellanilyticum]
MRHFALLCFLPLASVMGADWPQWRGPDRNGISKETDWKVDWKDSPKILWKASVGLGYSSFVVADGKVYTTGHADGKDTVFCFDAVTGKEVWKHTYPAELGDKFFQGGTTGTPTLADGKLYHLSRWGDMFCFDAATGKIVWQKNIQQETGLRLPDWGYTGAPLIWENLVVLNVGEHGVALDKASGKVVWKSPDENAGYSTPLPYQQDGKTLLTFGSGRAYVAIDPKTGAKVWEHKWTTSYGVNAADPVIHEGHAFISSGYNKGAALLKLGGSEPQVVWQNRVMRNQMNASILIDGHLYGIDGNEDRGASLKCIELATGRQLWEEKSAGAGAVIAAGDKLILLCESGELVVAKASPKAFEPLSRGQVLDPKCWTVPVLANGLLYGRNASGSVVCVDLRTK